MAWGRRVLNLIFGWNPAVSDIKGKPPPSGASYRAPLTRATEPFDYEFLRPILLGRRKLASGCGFRRHRRALAPRDLRDPSPIAGEPRQRRHGYTKIIDSVFCE
ncbi:hypothetical protein TIFTF001_033381 [Ficus carica]|uniref:Uncharacterized protein n=1 Tax=Ficus carica TaxID=3494 RepID=A0AA88E0H1_FICCA|nr:hypothetical protein TIFTF001_033381 [Ficus carica]